MTTVEPEPVRRSDLPPVPPPGWEVSTWFSASGGVGVMIPGQYERGVQVRRRVTYGDWEPVRPDHWADERIETELRTTDPHPRRGDAFEAWLRARRDEYGAPTVEWQALDYALDAYRLHADTGTPLDRHCCEGGTPDDCEGCAGERQASGS